MKCRYNSQNTSFTHDASHTFNEHFFASKMMFETVCVGDVAFQEAINSSLL